MLNRLNFGFHMWLLAVRATSGIVAWLVTLVAYRLFSWLTSRGFVPRSVPVLVILRTVVPVVTVLVVPFRANTGVF